MVQGQVLWAVNCDPEAALRAANSKLFAAWSLWRRLHALMAALEGMTLDEMPVL